MFWHTVVDNTDRSGDDLVVSTPAGPLYGPDLALVHQRGFGFHADACAPGILLRLQPVLERRGIVVELGCGSGQLTRHLVDAGHRVIATDASPAMLALARKHVPDAERIEPLTLPNDPIPTADAVVSVGHVLSYLPDEPALDRALTAAAAGLRAGGVLALDLCDLSYGAARRDDRLIARVEEDWAIVTRLSLPASNRFVRDMTTFVRDEDGRWRRDDEHHENVLTDTARLPALLGGLGITASIEASFGSEALPPGLVAVVGERSPG